MKKAKSARRWFGVAIVGMIVLALTLAHAILTLAGVI